MAAVCCHLHLPIYSAPCRQEKEEESHSMARMVSRPRRREGTGIGERLAEYSIFIIALVAIGLAARWYFVVYRHSPTYTLLQYLAAIKSGDPETQYNIISAGTKQSFSSKSNYADKWKSAQGFRGRLTDYTITK